MHGPEEGPVREAMALSDCEDSASVGLDVPTDSIAVAIARPGRGGPEWPGTIPNHRSALRHLITRRSPDGLGLRVGSKAGPCGDGIDREITATGHHGGVVAPGLVPRGATDRVKTDRRAATLRAREDRTALQTKARQRLGAFLLRTGRSRWSEAHTRGLETQAFARPVPPIVVQESVDATREATRRVADREDPIRAAAPVGSLAPRVEARIRLRGIPVRGAVTILAELGDTPALIRRGRGCASAAGFRVNAPRGRAAAPAGSPRPAPVLSGRFGWRRRGTSASRPARHGIGRPRPPPRRIGSRPASGRPHTRDPRGASARTPAVAVLCARSTARSPQPSPGSSWASSGPLSARSPSGHMPAGVGPERCRSQP